MESLREKVLMLLKESSIDAGIKSQLQANLQEVSLEDLKLIIQLLDKSTMFELSILKLEQKLSSIIDSTNADSAT